MKKMTEILRFVFPWIFLLGASMGTSRQPGARRGAAETITGNWTFSGTTLMTGKLGLGGANSGTYLLELYPSDINAMLISNTAGSTAVLLRATTQGYVAIDSNRDGNSTTSSQVKLMKNGSEIAHVEGDNVTNALRLDTGSTELSKTGINIDSAHNVGIGTTTTGAKLYVNGATILNANVGIGTTTVANVLTVSVPASDIGITLTDSGSNFNPAFLIKRVGASKLKMDCLNSQGHIYGMGSSGLFLGGSDSVEDMRLDTAGNVGIGTTAPSSRVSIATAATSTAFLSFAGAFATLPTTGYNEGTCAYQTSDHTLYCATTTVSAANSWKAAW